jgi:hypothetical protein
MSELVTLTAINHRDGTFHVHTAQCRDIAKGSQKANGVFDLVVFSKTEAVTELWSDFIDEWDGDLSEGWGNTQFFPCVMIPEVTPEVPEEEPIVVEAPLVKKSTKAVTFYATTPEGVTDTRTSKTRTYTHARWIKFPDEQSDKQIIISWHQSEDQAARGSFQHSSWKNYPWGYVRVSTEAPQPIVAVSEPEKAKPVVGLEQPKDIFASFDKSTPEILKTPLERKYDKAVKGSQARTTAVAKGQFKKISFNIKSRTVRIGTRVLAHNVATTDQAYAVLRQECGFNSLDFWTFATTFDQVAGILTTNVKVA